MDNSKSAGKTAGPLAIQHQNLLDVTSKIENLCLDIELKLSAISFHPARLEKLKDSDPSDHPLEKDLISELSSISGRLEHASDILKYIDNKLGGLF